MQAERRGTLLLGLIGSGIQASLSPALHEREGAAQGLPITYRLIDLDRLGLGPDRLEELLTAAQRMGFAGLNITYPCKQAVVPLLDELSEDARRLGAVNTVVLREGRRIGHNTDCSGFAASFRRGFADVRRERVVQLGAGGAGAAVAQALLSEGVGALTIADVEAERAESLAQRLRGDFGAERAVVAAAPPPPPPPGPLAAAVSAADGLVNCTPVGMAKLPGLPLPAALLRPALWVAEIVYFPLETELLRVARQLGCRTLDGSGMAVFQAAGAFRLFTGLEPDAGRMLDHFKAMIGKA